MNVSSQIKLHCDRDVYARCQKKLAVFKLSKEAGFRWCPNVSLPSVVSSNTKLLLLGVRRYIVPYAEPLMWKQFVFHDIMEAHLELYHVYQLKSAPLTNEKCITASLHTWFCCLV